MSRPSVTVISPKGESSETLVIPNVFRVSETPTGPGRANLHRMRISKTGTEKTTIGNGHSEFEMEDGSHNCALRIFSEGHGLG
jgi:hypothetical protein